VRSPATLPRLADRLVNLPTQERVKLHDLQKILDGIGQDAAPRGAR
jgi:hypothetical protein